VREGDFVRAGTVLAEFERSEQEAALRSAQADELAARTEASTADWNLEQTKELHAAGAVAERDLRAAEQAALTAKARYAAAESRVKAAASIERDTRVVSPVNGVVETRSIENGERVSRGGELFTIVRSDMLELTAAVPARRAAALTRGLEVRFSADGRSIQGRVARISPTIDLQSQSVTVFVQVPNGNNALKGNTFATGQIIERSLSGQLVIPSGAVRQTAAAAGGQTFVWKVAGGALVRADVKLGIVDESRGVVQVTEGLAVGDEIVVGNVGLLGAGMQVQIIGTEPARGRP
jgi:membrane fusion protein (multidrug efflux system)